MTPVSMEMTPTHQSENQQQQILPSSPESELEHQPNNINKKLAVDPIILPVAVDSDDGDDGSIELVHVAAKVTVERNDQNTDDTITAAGDIWVNASCLIKMEHIKIFDGSLLIN